MTIIADDFFFYCNIFYNITILFCIFDQINAAIVSIKDLINYKMLLKVYIYIYIYKHTHTNMYVCIYTYTYKHTQYTHIAILCKN